MIAFATLLLSAALLYAGSLLLALACLPVFQDYGLSRVASPVAFVLLFQFIEHFSGLGKIAWMSPPLLLGCAYAINRNGGLAAVKKNLDAELAAAAGFFYCFLWRCSYPDIDPS